MPSTELLDSFSSIARQSGAITEICRLDRVREAEEAVRQRGRLRPWLLQPANGRLWGRLEPKPSSQQETFFGLAELPARHIVLDAEGWATRA